MSPKREWKALTQAITTYSSLKYYLALLEEATDL